MIAAIESTPLIILLAIGGSLFGVYLLAHVIGFVFGLVAGVIGLVGGLVGRLGLFVGREIQDSLHLVGGVLTGAVIAPLAVVNAAMGRFSNAAHYGRAFRSELVGAGGSLYRVALGNPIWLLGLSPVTEGLERRLPELVSQAPRMGRKRRKRRSRSGLPAFEGYQVASELEAGGSGARLFLAQPDDKTLARYRRAGHADPGKVVIKSFDLVHGSTVPQIVRESRSLEAARTLGLVLDHELDEASFWYSMPYVPGEDLDVVTRKLHARAGQDGLDDRGLARAAGYTSDLLTTLTRFHRAGLWHKDIKPSNLIISEDRAHLVDLGLVTPLASAMTLTTHGTEFFRDPELVRMAMKGVKVREIDGVKFDLYSVGAVLFSMLENSFPAHGNLSRIGKRCPDALAFIVRRAMADLSQRYGSAEEMGQDLDMVLAARDPWAVKPAQLPSMGAVGGPARARSAAYTPTGPFTLGQDAPPVRPVHSNSGATQAPPPVAARKRRGVLGGLMAVTMFLMMFGGLSVLARTAWSRTQPRGISVSHFESYGGWPSARTVQAEARSSAAGDLERLEIEGRILLLPTVGLDPRHEQLRELRALLLDRGHALVGEDSAEASIELVARARAAAGLSGLGDPGAREQLREFLNSAEGVDALVWLGPGREGIGYEILLRGDRR